MSIEMLARMLGANVNRIAGMNREQAEDYLISLSGGVRKWHPTEVRHRIPCALGKLR